MESSEFLSAAKRMIEKVRGKTLNIEERREKAIELTALLLNEGRRSQTYREQAAQKQIHQMLEDPAGKPFTLAMTDQCFRSERASRVAGQVVYLIKKFGVPRFLSYRRQLEVAGFKVLGEKAPSLFTPILKRALRKETADVVIPGEKRKLISYLERRRKEKTRVNLNRLGEAVLGEEEAQKRLGLYLQDLARTEVEYISVKISSICSQVHLLAWEETLSILEERLKQLYRTAMSHTFVRPDGKIVQKFVNLDMEEYRELHLTVELFRRVLDDPEFHQCSAGIVLQSYLPESHLIQQELTVWAMQRAANGGAPIKIRLVKGANLAMEKVEASLKNWPQAPYRSKTEVDANFKKMLHYGCMPEHARASMIGVGSHNLFDVAYALLLRAENGVEEWVGFEMLEGIATQNKRVVHDLAGDMLLYAPAAKKQDFVHAIAYLVRRLDENTSPENFLRHLFSLIPGTQDWQSQVNYFSLACHSTQAVPVSTRRTQSRFKEPQPLPADIPFRNEADTDWTAPQNRRWGAGILDSLKKREFGTVPCVIAGKEMEEGEESGVGRDPSCPQAELYRYPMIGPSQVDTVLRSAEKAQKKWGSLPAKERSSILAKAADGFRRRRGELIGAMAADGGKTVMESDVEISEAIDLIEYYRRQVEELDRMEGISWKPKGVVLVTPPWNFPCAIPTGGVAGALAAGNAVVLKPARDAAHVGYLLASIFWEAGIDRSLLQFVLCKGSTVGSELVKDPRVSLVVLTGSTETAKLMLKMRPGLDLMAETGGKNGMIVSDMSDRDLAIKDLVESAFHHAGQKCSACSLAILLPEVYDDQRFLQQLKDAAMSMPVGPAWDPATRVNPLIHEPNETLKRGLTQLEEGESWLLEPQQNPSNPNLWSPGIKMGVKESSFSYQNELFGPVLSVMRAESLEHAVALSNGTPYGLTAGLHSLDEREQQYWMDNIQAGNCYINRGMTGAVVNRQPFGGCKESSFGPGFKAGGPNYVIGMMQAKERSLPTEGERAGPSIHLLSLSIKKEEKEAWEASIENYAYEWNRYFSRGHDPSLIVGQDNILTYAPHSRVYLRMQNHDSLYDAMRVVAACVTCGTALTVSGNPDTLEPLVNSEWAKLAANVSVIEEMESQFAERGARGEMKRVRLLSDPSEALKKALAEGACNVALSPVSSYGRVELLHYLREVSLSRDYHRYGNLGTREKEKRAPVL